MVLESNNQAFLLLISSQSFESFKGLSEIKVYTHLQFSNDLFQLYGFSEKEERNFYRKLIQVSGIGPKLAIRVLSQINYKTLMQHIVNADETAIFKISGIGKKTASKMIIEIKDKINIQEIENSLDLQNTSSLVFKEAAMALESLGFDNKKVQDVLKKLNNLSEHAELEEVIKKALSLLNKK